MDDAISPKHYQKGPVEVIQITRHLPGNISNAIKYITRCGLKASEPWDRELGKALWYLQDFQLHYPEVAKAAYYHKEYVWQASQTLDRLAQYLTPKEEGAPLRDSARVILLGHLYGVLVHAYHGREDKALQTVAMFLREAESFKTL